MREADTRQQAFRLSGCCMILMVVAVLYAWSVFAAYLENSLGWDRSRTSAIYSVSICSFCIGCYINGRLERKFPAATRMTAVAALMCLGYLIMLKPSFPSVLIGYGVICSLGVGITYNLILAFSIGLFPGRPGLCTGILLTCYGFATFPMSMISNFLLGKYGWGRTAAVFAAMEGILLAAGGRIFLSKTDSAGEIRDGGTRPDGTGAESFIRSKTFLLLFLWLLCICICALTVTGCIVQMGRSVHMEARTSALMPGIVSIAGCVGRFGMGWLFDKAEKRVPGLLVSCSALCSMLLFRISFASSSGFCFVAASVLLGIAFGGMASLSSAYVRYLFGEESYARNFSIILFHMIPAAVVSGSLANLTNRNPGFLFLVLLLISAVSCSFPFSFKRVPGPGQ